MNTFGFCQSENKNSFGLTFGFGSSQFAFNGDYIKDWRVGKKKKFGMGIGARFSIHSGRNLYFATAPAKLTSGSNSPLILFKDNINKNIDSVQLKSSFVGMFNLLINLDYAFSQKFMVGFNIDFIGFSFGAKQSGTYLKEGIGTPTEASPSPFNLLLISDNDLGSLNSELYFKYFINENWGIKAAAQFIFAEYTTTSKVQTFPSENDRFRKKGLLPSIGVVYRL